MKQRRLAIPLGLLLVVLAAGAFRTGGAAAAAPFVPASDTQILEHLPAGRSDGPTRELAEMRRKLQEHPDDVELAVALARRNVEEGRMLRDPRYLGYAQAALGRFWSEEAPAPPVLVLRATIRQSLHDFEGALRDLDAAVVRAPQDPQAWITRSVVLTVRGKYEAARESCLPLAHLTSPLVTTVCFASIDAITGDAKGAHARLLATVERTEHASANEEAWAQSILGEIAVRIGDVAAAERHFDRTLAIDPTDAYTLAAWADLLLDEGRADEVVKRLAGSERNDGLLLRLALASNASKAPRARSDADTLRDRFAASRARGDTVHRREEARFTLAIERDAPAALTLAKANWDVQKEPWDARVYLEAALAAGDAAAAARVLAWLEDTRLEDPAIARAATCLRSMR